MRQQPGQGELNHWRTAMQPLRECAQALIVPHNDNKFPDLGHAITGTFFGSQKRQEPPQFEKTPGEIRFMLRYMSLLIIWMPGLG